MKRSFNQLKNWRWASLVTLSLAFSNFGVFAQTCSDPQDPSDEVNMENLKDIAKESKEKFERTGTDTKTEYLDGLRKMLILLSTKRNALDEKRRMAQKSFEDQMNEFRSDEATLVDLDQQMQDQLKNLVGADEAAKMAAEWAQNVTVGERESVVAEFSQSKMSIQGIVVPRAKEMGLSDSDLRKVKLVSMMFAPIQPGRLIIEQGKGGARVVEISWPFQIAKTEFTQLEYLAIMGNMPELFLRYYNVDHAAKDYMKVAGYEINANHPMVYVSRDAVLGVVEKLNKIDLDYNYFLPTETGWEYVARAGTTSAYSFGDETSNIDEYAVKEYMAEVASKKPNPWGLYDVHGNVAEWTSDLYTYDVYSAVRGGAFDSKDDLSLSSTVRELVDRKRDLNRSIGFRVGRSPR